MLTQLIESFTWYRYSKKALARLENPRCAGKFDPAASDERGVRLVTAEAGFAEDGNKVRIEWLVDRDDGIIVDARFSAFGQTALLIAADIGCELCISKNYDQARRLTTELMDKALRDKGDQPAFPKETLPHLQLVIEALHDAADHCNDLPLSVAYVAPPVPSDQMAIEGNGYPGWLELPYQQKIAVIEQVLDDDVRPYISLDAGGVNVLKLEDNTRLLIGYTGTCTSCYSSVGTTLSYIQQVLRAKVHPDLNVIPDL
ncbi:MAG: NifU family protein [Parachlamydiales bacterium]|jgi:NifU-like protein